MDKTTEKFNELLKLLNNCRQKLSALSDLFVSCVLSAKSKSQDMVQKLHELSSARDDLVGLTNAIATASKENRDKNKRVAMPKIREIKSKIKDLKIEFWEDKQSFDTALNEPISLRPKYKGEVAQCCNCYKSMSQNGVTPIVEKGYRQQVKIIRRILDRINNLIAEYNTTKEKNEQTVDMFNKLFGLVDTLAVKLAE